MKDKFPLVTLLVGLVAGVFIGASIFVGAWHDMKKERDALRAEVRQYEEAVQQRMVLQAQVDVLHQLIREKYGNKEPAP